MREVQERGAGEIVLNCMASDGVRRGYDIAQLAAVRRICKVPLVASGGAGAPEHFAEVFNEARVDAALAASVFHSGAHRRFPSLKHSCATQASRCAHEARMRLPRSTGTRMTACCPRSCRTRAAAACLMLGYMNREALRMTLAEARDVFFSRSRKRLWTKGESSGHWLHVVDVETDCDRDTLLVLGESARADLP